MGIGEKIVVAIRQRQDTGTAAKYVFLQMVHSLKNQTKPKDETHLLELMPFL
jgi:hypothetical protein